MNHAHKPFGNENIRSAIAHAINKEAIVDAVFNGVEAGRQLERRWG